MKETVSKRIIQILVILALLFSVATNIGKFDKGQSSDSIPNTLNKEEDVSNNSFSNYPTSNDNNFYLIEEKDEYKGDLFENETISSVREEDEILDNISNQEASSAERELDIFSVEGYSGEPYIILNNNEPLFSYEDKSNYSFEYYSELDNLGRCGVAFACISTDTMPTEERGSIGMIKPSGWHTVKYNDLIEGNYLYNRCHLIGYQLAGENDNFKNLITGTRYLNKEGMLPFEDKVAIYVNETNNHVLYRVTPVFQGNNLVASGVTIEAYSIEDSGEGICFYVYIYNVQPGIIINYQDGESERDPKYQVNSADNQLSNEDSSINQDEYQDEYPEGTYILNTNTHRFHYPSCESVSDMAEKNKKVSYSTREEIIEQGYSPCKRCNP